MPPLDLGLDNPADVDNGYQEFVFDEEREFEDIRRYSLSNSASIRSQLSQNPSSPMSQETLSSNSSSPVITGRISNNTSSPFVSNTEFLSPLESNDDGDMYDDEYEGQYITTYEEYQNPASRVVTIGRNEEEEEWQIQSLTLPEEMGEKEIQEALDSIQEIIEELEDSEFKQLDKNDFRKVNDQRSES